MTDGSETVQLLKKYRAGSIYLRELRPYRIRHIGRMRLRSPNSDLIKPRKEFRIYGGRTGILDRSQGIFGYFFGGGWVHGIVENERFRASPASIDEYKQSYDLSLGYRAGNPFGKKQKSMTWRPGVRIPPKIRKDTYIEVKVERSAFTAVGLLPKLDSLRQIDKLAVEHDLELRKLDAKAWADRDYARSKKYSDDKEGVNRVLRKGLIQYRDEWPDIKQDWKSAKSQISKDEWEAYGSLIYYERALVNSAIFYLSFADGVSGYGSRISKVGKEFQESKLYSYSPPAIKLSQKTAARVLSRNGQSVLERISNDEKTMNNLMYEYYDREQDRLAREYHQEFSQGE